MAQGTVDLNSDIGESFGSYHIGQDEEVLEFITSANIACGFHAGDPKVMNNTVKLAIERGVVIGAHPGLPDLVGFGRRFIDVTPEEVYTMVVYQISSLHGFANVHGSKLHHVKPHGALYSMACKDVHTAEAVAKAVHDCDSSLILFGLAGSELIQAGKKMGLQVAEEVFADRTYQPDGTLTPRSDPQAFIEDSTIAMDRVLRMVSEGVVRTVDGSDIPIKVDTICVHGDQLKALLFVKELRELFLKHHISVKAVNKL
jgi:UPF0271 protein